MLGDSFELGNYPSNHQVVGERRRWGEGRKKEGEKKQHERHNHQRMGAGNHSTKMKYKITFAHPLEVKRNSFIIIKHLKTRFTAALQRQAWKHTPNLVTTHHHNYKTITDETVSH